MDEVHHLALAGSKRYNLATGRIKVPFVVFTSTVLDNPSLPGSTDVILPMGQISLFMLSSVTSTISPSFGTGRFVIHFVRLTKFFNGNSFSATAGFYSMGTSLNALPIKIQKFCRNVAKI
ncbi:hypothetical protein T12_3480 [Trichinella patagoniensis]|uniref:Uncharacterized protein n=1 Tax=Trichinella patagoniensis TaxID=990121 RepID=A0A0V0ZUE9_9BILA|nr:hypothetical protein T12_3480 [Trichinella patagoniensis]